MDTFVKTGGTFTKARKIFVKVAGTWTEATKVFVKSAGSWVQVFTNATVVNPIPAIVVYDDQIFPTDSLASFTILTDGTVSVLGNGSSTAGNWFTPTTTGIGSSYWVRVTKNSGANNTSGQALGTWLQLSSNRSWTWVVTGNNSLSANLTIEIATDSLGSNIVATEASVNVWSASLP